MLNLAAHPCAPLLLGPPKYFNGDDWKSERMAELDAITVKEFHEAAGKLTYLERMINQKARRNLTDAERNLAMKQLVAMLRQRVAQSAFN